MGWIAEGTEIGIVRRDDDGFATGREQTVKFLHGLNDVADMLDHVRGSDFAKRTVAEWKGIVIEIRNHVGPGVRVSVQADGSGVLVNAATNVKNRQGSGIAGGYGGFRNGAYCS